jgi:hypothetical protein
LGAMEAASKAVEAAAEAKEAASGAMEAVSRAEEAAAVSAGAGAPHTSGDRAGLAGAPPTSGDLAGLAGRRQLPEGAMPGPMATPTVAAQRSRAIRRPARDPMTPRATRRDLPRPAHAGQTRLEPTGVCNRKRPGSASVMDISRLWAT